MGYEAVVQALDMAHQALNEAQDALVAAESVRDNLTAPAQAYEDALAKVKQAEAAVAKAQEALDAANAPTDPEENTPGETPKGKQGGSAGSGSAGKAPQGDAPALPATGADGIVPLMLAGLGLAAAGTVLVRVRRQND